MGDDRGRKSRLFVVLPITLIVIGFASVRIGLSIAALNRVVSLEEFVTDSDLDLLSQQWAPFSPKETASALAAALQDGSSDAFSSLCSGVQRYLGHKPNTPIASDMDLIKLVLESDAQKVGGPARLFESRVSSNFDGWRCGVSGPGFYKIINLPNGRSYKVRGRFIPHGSGGWTGEFDRIIQQEADEIAWAEAKLDLIGRVGPESSV